MLKLTASFSKKVPVEGADYSSQSYHAAVEVEIPDGQTPEQLQTRIRQTFEMVRNSVESELHNGHNPAAPIETAPVPGSKEKPAESAPVGGNGTAPAANGNPVQKASGKQIKFLSDLAVKHQLDLKELDAIARGEFKVSAGCNDLTRKQASAFIDRFQQIVVAQRRAA